MFASRLVTQDDYAAICGFPQNADELYYAYPSAVYPLTPEQLDANVRKRLFPTVVTAADNAVAGFANLYDLADGERVWLGNVLVSLAHRGTGAAAALVGRMIAVARDELRVKELHLVVHQPNGRAMLFYAKLGFRPYAIEKAADRHGNPIAKIRMSIGLTDEAGG